MKLLLDEMYAGLKEYLVFSPINSQAMFTDLSQPCELAGSLLAWAGMAERRAKSSTAKIKVMNATVSDLRLMF